MRRFRSVAGFGSPRKGTVGLLTFVCVALLPCGVAFAGTFTSNFNNFSPGTINGQFGWKSALAGQPSCPPYSAYDQAVVNTLAYPNGAASGFGAQSWRFSNLFGCGEFTYQTYSHPLTDPAGEDQANTVFNAQFSFIPTTSAVQDGLYVSVSPDDYMGGRMLRIDLTSTADGVLVAVADSPALDGDIEAHPVAVLDPSKPHTIAMSMKFNSGPNNDLARVSIDGADTGQCFSSWENFYRAFQPDMFPTTNSLQFRSAINSFDTPNAGYLFQSVTTTTSTGPGPQDCNLDIGKQADSPTVTAGGLEGYRLTVRNRGRTAARNYLVCDHIPRETRFVTADRRLRRIGTRRCLFIRRLGPGQSASVHLTLRVDANAPPGALDNIADVTPEAPPGVPAAPATVTEDLPPGAAAAPIAPIKKAKVVVRILRAAQPPAPTVTG